MFLNGMPDKRHRFQVSQKSSNVKPSFRRTSPSHRRRASKGASFNFSRMISRLLPKSSPLRRFSFNFYADSPSISVSRCRSNSNFTLRSLSSNHSGSSGGNNVAGEVKYANFVWEKLYPPEEREDYCSSDVVIEAQSKGILECMKIIERKGCFSETIGEVESKRLADLLNRDH